MNKAFLYFAECHLKFFTQSRVQFWSKLFLKLTSALTKILVFRGSNYLDFTVEIEFHFCSE